MHIGDSGGALDDVVDNTGTDGKRNHIRLGSDLFCQHIGDGAVRMQSGGTREDVRRVLIGKLFGSLFPAAAKVFSSAMIHGFLPGKTLAIKFLSSFNAPLPMAKYAVCIPSGILIYCMMFPYDCSRGIAFQLK